MLLIESLPFIFTHLSALLFFLVLAYLYGAGALVVLGGRPEIGDRIFINTALGLGVIILLLFFLSALKLLSVPIVSFSLLIFSVLSLFVLYKNNDLLSTFSFSLSWRGGSLVVLGVSAIVLLPLYPPVIWDELSYHLPYAQFYVENNGLAVNPYLRYPLYSHNFNLIYSLSLLYQDDILAHCFHMAAGGLIAIGMVSFSKRFSHINIGLIAALLFLLSPVVRLYMKTAYIDLGLSLFVFLAIYSLMLFDQEKKRAWLIVCAAALGMAGGTKYLGLTYIPIFMIFLWLMDKRVKSQVLFLSVALLVACPWYVRSAIISGNPFSPFAGDIFGYWIWTAVDLSAQKEELFQLHGFKRNIASFFQLPINMLQHPEKFKAFSSSFIWFFSLWSCALFFIKFSRVHRFLIVFASVNLLFWFMGAQLLRYLLPILPLLALLSAVLMYYAGKIIKEKLLPARRLLPDFSTSRDKTIFFMILVVCCLALALRLQKYPVPTSAIERDQYLTEKLDFYSLINFSLNNTTGKIYQFGFENSFYYGGERIMGDWYGLARYRPLFEAAGQPAVIHQYLQHLNADVFILNKSRIPFNQTKIKALIDCGFTVLYEDDKGAVLDVPLKCEQQ